MELKGLEKINNILIEYLSKFGVETVLVDSDFFCYPGDSEIHYAFTSTQNSVDYFLEFCKQLRPNIHADCFLLSLLHEVGHIETWDEVEECDYLFSEDMKEAISEILENENDDQNLIRDMHFQYFNLPDEKMATEWALDYIEMNAEEVAQFWAKLQPAILEFYKLNKINLGES